MKRWLLFLFFIPVTVHAQADSSCTYDMYNCYLHSLRSYLNGSSGLEQMNSKYVKKNTSTLYIAKRFYTSGFPEIIDGYNVQYIDIDDNKELLYNELKSKKGALLYMSELNVTADVCDLWLMPVEIIKNKKDGGFEPLYKEKGCHLYFRVCKDNGKLSYKNTICPTDKD